MTSIPASADAIDAEWLEQALAPRHPGVRVRAVRVTARQQWTNAHAWLAVDYHEPAGAPPTLFCKLLPADARRAAIAATGMGLREALFYQRLAPLLPLRVPRSHAVLMDPAGGEFLMLLEDLVASGCSVSDGPTGIAPAAAARALEDLAGLHVRFEEPASRAHRLRRGMAAAPPVRILRRARLLPGSHVPAGRHAEAARVRRVAARARRGRHRRPGGARGLARIRRVGRHSCRLVPARMLLSP